MELIIIEEIASQVSFNDYYHNELGGLINYKNEDYGDIVIFVDVEINDDKIKSLVDQLPKFKKL